MLIANLRFQVTVNKKLTKLCMLQTQVGGRLGGKRKFNLHITEG